MSVDTHQSAEPTSEELRSFTRVSIRTSAMIYTQDDNGHIQATKAWTDDISPGGAKIITEALIPADQFYVRIMIPELKDQVLLCKATRRARTVVQTLRNNLDDIQRFTCGIEFIGVCTGADLKQIQHLEQNR